MSIISSIENLSDASVSFFSTGQFFWHNVSSDEKVFCYTLDKCYLTSQDKLVFDDILVDLMTSKDLVEFGNIVEIKSEDGSVRYRQRFHSKSMSSLLNFCKMQGLRVRFDMDFHISINGFIKNSDQLKYLAVYAKKFNETLDTWLCNVCKVNLYYLMQKLGFGDTLKMSVERVLEDREGYMNRAPFMALAGTSSGRRTALYLPLDVNDKRLITIPCEDEKDLKYGYTNKNLSKDIKAGVFR